MTAFEPSPPSFAGCEPSGTATPTREQADAETPTRQVPIAQDELIAALADRDLTLPPLEQDPVAIRLGLTSTGAPRETDR